MITITNEDNMELMARLEDESIDVICIDPPYLYLKNQKLERVFDEQLFFSECKRLLTKNGFIVMFGRGVSFYRWNTILESMDFKFKEEVVWNKIMNSIPAAPILRTHELIVIYTKGIGKINRIKVPYIQSKEHNIDSIIQDVKRINSAIRSSKELMDILKFLESGEINYTEKKSKNFFKNSFGERSRGLATIRTIQNGMTEKTIIQEIRDHYSSIHPTQKPVRLIERLLALVIPDKPRKFITVADFFGGSFSTMEAVYNMGMQGVSCEIDKEYFDLGEKRIKEIQSQVKLDLTA